MSVAIKLILVCIGLCIVAIALLSWKLGVFDTFCYWLLPMIAIRLLAMCLKLNIFERWRQ